MIEVSLVDARLVEETIANDVQFVKSAVRRALQLHSAGRVIAGPKQALREPGTDNPLDMLMSMAARVVGDSSLSGVKWLGSNPANHRAGLPRSHSLIVLNDSQTKVPRAILDGTLISSMRTLGVSLLLLDCFSPAPATVACIGMGQLGRLHSTWLPREYPAIREIRVYSRRAEARLEQATSAFRRCSTVAEALDGADVVVLATDAVKPYIGPEHLRRARLILNLSFRDVKIEALEPADMIVVDDLEQTLRSCRALRQALEAGSLERSRIRELGAVVGETFESFEQVHAIPRGMAIEDIVLAEMIYRKVAISRNVPVFRIGSQIDTYAQ